MKLVAAIFFTLILTSVVYGEERIPDVPLQDILNSEVTVASLKPRRLNETPAIVSVVSREEIEMSGARDLVDVLRAIPGFEFGVDIWNNLNISFRGSTGIGGRLLVLVDGLVIPDLLYGDFDLSNRFPIDLIERVEIIRGPGSAIYGNFAELAVVNVVTKIGAESNKSQATYTSGYYSESSARQNLELQYARPGNNSYVGISLFGGLFNRSDRTYIAPNGAPWNMQNDSGLRTDNINVNLRYGDLSGKLMFDTSRVGYRDGFVDVMVLPKWHAEYRSYFGDVSYAYHPISKLVITPQFEFKMSQPYWSVQLPLNDPNYYDATALHYGYGLKATYDINDWVSVLVGGKYESEHAYYGGNEPERYYHFPGNSSSMSLDRYSVFGEGVIGTPYVDITAGLRYEETSSYNSSVVPRIGLTKSFGDTHIKLIYNRAYRAPTIEQISGGVVSGKPLYTETGDVYEVEVGQRLNDSQIVAVNFYEMRMQRVINYQYDTVRQINTYINSGSEGSMGVDAEYKYNDGKAHATLRYSFLYADNPDNSIWTVPGNSNLFVGIPAHKVSIDAGYKITKNLSINTTGIYTSEAYAYTSVDPTTGSSVLSRFKPEFYQNLYLLNKNVIWQGFDVGVGIYDLFGSHHSYLATYDNGHAPLPAGSREYLVKLSYSL